MARLAAERSCDYAHEGAFPSSPAIDNPPRSSLSRVHHKVLISHERRLLNRVMSDFVGIVRREEHLRLALEKVTVIHEIVQQHYLSSPATCAVVELRNLATLAELIIKSALQRHESRGLHYVLDYPELKDEFATDTIIPGLKNE